MKDTPTSLAQLGESLAESFYDRLLGLGLPDDAAFEMPASDLSALYSLGGDIHHWQNVEMDWEQLEAQFTGGFVPENLIAPGETGNNEEQNATDTHTPRRQPQMRNYPFVADSSSRVFAESETAYSRLSINPADQLPEARQTFRTGQESLPNKTPTETNDIPVMASHRDDIPLPTLNGVSATPQTPNSPEPAETRGKRPLDRVNPESPPPQPINPENLPNDLAAFHPEPAPSIWSQPLQGLGDFVSHYEPSTEPVPEKNFIADQSSRPVAPSPVEDSNRILMPLAVEDLLPGSTIVQPEPGLPQQKAILEKNTDTPENQIFKSIDNNPDPTAVLPDTDDILDELTQRIIRDFRRFYP